MYIYIYTYVYMISINTEINPQLVCPNVRKFSQNSWHVNLKQTVQKPNQPVLLQLQLVQLFTAA